MDFPLGLLPSLRRWGVLRTEAVERALEDLPWGQLLADGPDRVGRLFSPHADPSGAVELSLRTSVLVAELLDLQQGHVVALPAPAPRFLLALLDALGARRMDPLRDEKADRAVELGPAPRATPIRPGGFALRLSFEPYQESLTKILHEPAGEARLGLENLPLVPGQAPPRPIRQLLVVEGFCRRALAAAPVTPQDRLFVDAVAEVWNPAAARSADAAAREALAVSRQWFHLAYIHQFSADVGDALELYEASLAAHPTAEAHTFLAWALAFTGDYRGAIQRCQAAVACDPSLGNPYNDIGAYHLELGQGALALPWFDRALQAPRYAAPHFAHCNKGRALLLLGRPDETKRAFRAALELQPGYRPAAAHLESIGP